MMYSTHFKAMFISHVPLGGGGAQPAAAGGGGAALQEGPALPGETATTELTAGRIPSSKFQIPDPLPELKITAGPRPFSVQFSTMDTQNLIMIVY